MVILMRTLLSLILLIISFSSYADFNKNKIAILDFQVQGSGFDVKDMGQIVAEWLTTDFVKAGRFEIVERRMLKQILEEQQLMEIGVVDQEKVIKLGKLLGVEAIITGSIIKFPGAMEVNTRIINIERASIIAADNIQGNNTAELRPLVQKMALKIMHNFPLEGYIVRRNSNDKHVTIDLGSSAGVMQGMEFIVYKEGEVIRHPKTGEVLDVRHLELGKIRIAEVREKIANGTILYEKPSQAIKYGHLVKSAVPSTTPLVSTPYTPKQNPVRDSAISTIRLYVDTKPIQAKVRILNIIPKYYAGIALKPGKYHLELSAPHYIKKYQWITLTKEQTEKHISITLQASSSSTYRTKTSKADRNTSISTLPVDLTQKLKKFQGNNFAERVYAAKYIQKHYINYPVVQDIAKNQLLKNYKKDQLHRHQLKALLYACNILGLSGNKIFIPVLEKVAKEATYTKLRRYAAKNAKRLMN